MERETVYAYGKPQIVLLRIAQRLPSYEERQSWLKELRVTVDQTPDLKGLPIAIVGENTNIEVVSLKPEPVGEPV